jgi:hypothetical protein
MMTKEPGCGRLLEKISTLIYKSKGGITLSIMSPVNGVGSGVIPIYAKGQTAGTPAFQIY